MAKGVALVLAGVGAATAVYGAVQQRKESKKAQAASDRSYQAQIQSQKLEQRKQDMAAARERRQQYRQARMARAQIAATSGAAGTAQTSGAIGGRGSVGSQAGGNVSYLNQQQGMTQRQSIFNIASATAQGQANKASSKASMWGGISSLGGSIFGAAGGFGAFEGLGGQVANQFTPNGSTGSNIFGQTLQGGRGSNTFAWK